MEEGDDVAYTGHAGGRSAQLRVKLHTHVRDVLSGRLLSLVGEDTCVARPGQRIIDDGRREEDVHIGRGRQSDNRSSS